MFWRVKIIVLKTYHRFTMLSVSQQQDLIQYTNETPSTCCCDKYTDRAAFLFFGMMAKDTTNNAKKSFLLIPFLRDSSVPIHARVTLGGIIYRNRFAGASISGLCDFSALIETPSRHT